MGNKKNYQDLVESANISGDHQDNTIDGVIIIKGHNFETVEQIIKIVSLFRKNQSLKISKSGLDTWAGH